METLTLSQRDHRCIWHPFTQMGTAPLPIPIVQGKGVWLIAEDGQKYLDAFSSWWVNLHGHGQPYLIDALIKQAYQLEHMPYTDFAHRPAVELAERLLTLLPSHTKVFYSENGATAVEAALKMVFQYWVNKDGETKQRTLVCFKNGYHGDTFGAMSVAGKGTFNKPFWPFLFKVVSIDPPWIGQEDKSLCQLQEATANYDVAGFIFEPHIQGVGGMRTHSLEGLDRLMAECHKQRILTIADEVMTGFGRTGPLFVCQGLKNPPSILCLAKGMTGGMLPLAATICQQHIFDAFFSHEKAKAFLHGHSYFGNPLACATALASLDLLQSSACQIQRRCIEEQHLTFCAKWKGHSSLQRLETIGTILAVEYEGDNSYFKSSNEQLKHFFLENGVLVRPIGNVLHLMPPYCIQENELADVYRLIVQTMEHPL